MRLHGYLKKLIKKSLAKAYNNADMVIFGSRANDDKKGGDIDIAIKTDIPSDEFKQKKIHFLTSLMRQGIDLRVDLVQYHDAMDSLLKLEIQRDGKAL